MEKKINTQSGWKILYRGYKGIMNYFIF